MAFLHAQSCECIKSELDIFAIPPTQVSIEGGQWIHYKPLSSLSDDSPIEFLISGHGEEYIDLSQTMLYLKVNITKSDGTTIADTDDVGPVNNWLHSLFSQVDIFLNQKLISPPSNTYAYRAYIETLLNYAPQAKKSHLTSTLWYTDTAGRMNSITDKKNDGLEKRKEFIQKGMYVDMIGHLHCDIFNQEKFLINGVEMRIRCVRSKDNFCLMATQANNKVHISEASLLIRRMKINPNVLLAHHKSLNTTTAKYPVTRTDVKVITIPSGVQSKSLDNLFLGQIPKRVIIGFVSNKAYNGDITLNPFNFDSYTLNFLSMYIEGTQIPTKPLQPNFYNDAPSFIRSYQTLFSGTGIHFLNQGNGISRQGYPNGYCLFAFDLTPDLSANSMSHWNLVKYGNLRLEVRFASSLSETLNCLIYAEFDNIIEIDKARNVIADYGN